MTCRVGEILFVCTFIIYGQHDRYNSEKEGSEAKVNGSEGQPKESKLLPKGLQGYPEGSKGQVMDICMDVGTY